MLACLQGNLFYEALVYWLLITGVLGFLAMGLDKARARGGGWRIPELTLLLISLAGGFLGVVLGSIAFRHKTSKLSFLVLLLPIFVVWLAAMQHVGILGCLGTYLPH